MINTLRKQVLAGLYIALLLIAIVLAAPTPTLADTGNPGDEHCYWGCCLYISSWCVWHCIVCEDVPTSQ